MREQRDRLAWPWRRVCLWSAALAVAWALCGPRFVANVWQDPARLEDFFQEWASARFWYDGLPVYTPQEQAIEPYLGRTPAEVGDFNTLNAHPPTSVLLALPLGGMRYATARLVWNLCSLGCLAVGLVVIARALRLSLSGWAILPLLALALLCEPLHEQNEFAQYNLFLLLLIVGAWALERSGRPGAGGFLLGTAVVLKLFPAFLLLPYLVRRRWKMVASAGLTACAWTGLTLVVLGWGTYREYVEQVLPHLRKYHAFWSNFSLTGFWHRTLQGARQAGLPLPADEVGLAVRLAVAGSSLLVVALVARSAARACSREEVDRAVGCAVAGMLLLSPLTWLHAFLLLLLPAALLWHASGPWRLRRLLLAACLALLFLRHPESRWGDAWARVALMLQHAALLGFFALAAWQTSRAAVTEAPQGTPPSFVRRRGAAKIPSSLEARGRQEGVCLPPDGPSSGPAPRRGRPGLSSM
jgi:alpha-1,2-mannosyltransferase